LDLADILGAATFCPLSDNSGQTWILTGDGLSAYDPSATVVVHCGNGFDAGLPRYKRRGDCDLRTVPHHK
jgi:hypothetical protein